MPKSKKRVLKRKKINNSSYLKVILVIAILLAILLILRTSQGKADNMGVLGLLARDGDDSSGSGNSGSSSDSDSGSSGSDSSGSSGESDNSGSGSSGSSSGSDNSGSSEISPTGNTSREILDEDEDSDTEDENGVRVRTTSEKTEIKISETEKIRAITKDGRTRIDITSGGVKTRLEIRDGRVIIKAENEDGTEEELADDTIFKIDDRLSLSGIKVATAGAEGFLVQRGGIGAATEFPLSIDLSTNALLVNTPVGQKEVTVLPDQAVQNLIAANIINQLIQNNNLDTSNINSVNSVIALGEENGILVYQITGVSNQKLLGFIPVKVEKLVTVSADTGETTSTQTPFVDRVIDLLSI